MATSSVVTVEVEVVADFNGNGAGWTKAPGSSVGAGQMGSVTNGVYVVTDGVNNTVSAFWYNSPIYVGGFSSYFTYQALPGTNGLADGTCFVIQNDPRGTTAIGGGGGQFAYAGGAGVVITPSVAFEINIYNGHARGYAFGINGSISYNAVADPNPASGDVIDVSMFYDGAVLSVTAFDETTLGTYTTSQAVNIPGTIGNNCGYVGITGACGGQDSVQSVSNFAYYPIPMLAATVSGNNIVLSWPNCVGGYVLQQETDLAAGTWADVSTPPTSVGGNLQVTVPNNGTQQFFRLRLFTQ
jgi:hypothetical protein